MRTRLGNPPSGLRSGKASYRIVHKLHKKVDFLKLRIFQYTATTGWRLTDFRSPAFISGFACAVRRLIIISVPKA